MALLNPIYGFVLPFLFVFTIPLAIIAIVTTTFAFSILLFRVVLVYIELAFAVIPHYIFGSQPSLLPSRSKKPNVLALPTARRRKRRNSSSSALSAGSLTPVASEGVLNGLSQSVGVARDFEGVGGWRLGDSPNDDTLWTNINTRLELPADHGRRHHRSLTSGSISVDTKQPRNPSPEAVMNSSRARTPPTTHMGNDGYFPLVGPKAHKRTQSTAGAGSPASSTSSKGSTVLSMKQRISEQ